MNHALRTWPLLLCSLLLTRYAGASLEFPAEVKKFYGVETLPATPPSCTLCHRSNDGGADTVVRPFGLTLIRLGAVKNSIPSLDSALSQVEQNATDSDADGVSDVAELRMGSDPNVGTGETADPLADVPFPETGCSLAARHTSASAEALALLCAALLRCARRRR
jgi:hypothetical protein